MTEREIRYCTTTDGVQIAYAVLGDGFPVVTIPAWASHVELDGFPPDPGPFKLIHYDKRGTGLSDRDLGDYAIETRLRDLEAVIQAAVGDGWFALYGNSEGCPLAIAYAGRHQQRVSRLILDGGFAVGDRTDEERATRTALVALVKADWGMGSAALTSVFFDDDTAPDVLTYWNRLQREAVTPQDAAAMWEANGRVDVSDHLSSIECPTLVIHGRNDRAVPFDRGREITSGIRGARLAPDDGGHKGNLVARGAATLRFLLEDEHVAGWRPERPQNEAPREQRAVAPSPVQSSGKTEPRIQYARTGDGVNIALLALGSGYPLVQLPPLPWSHIERERDMPEFRGWSERIAQACLLVRFDPRGTGLSDREVGSVQLDSYVTDLEAVVDRLQLDQVALFGPVNSGPVAIAYAAGHPERVSHLVLWCTVARGAAAFESQQRDALAALLDKDWEMYTETMAHVALGWSLPEEARRSAAWLRECVTQAGAQRVYDAIRNCDVTALLPGIVCPTLVIYRREVPWPGIDASRSLAALIPNARMAVLEGKVLLPWLGPADDLLAAMDEFLGISTAATSSPQGHIPTGTAIILFADIVDSTGLTERMGDAAFRERARELEAKLRAAIADSGGAAVEGRTLGDGVLATFPAARQAIECALRCSHEGANSELPLHLGIHAGDVTREGNDIHGGAVNVAARISALSAGGEVLVSDIVRGLGRTSADVVFEDRGERSLKGVSEPVRVYEVLPRA